MRDLKISTELASAVLGFNVVYIESCENRDNIIGIWADMNTKPIKEINIYEFAFKCKEWAFKNKYKIQSQISESNKGHSHITKKNDDCWAKGFFENTEIEAIIKASEYVLKELNENR